MESKTSVTLLERLRDGSDDVAWQEFFQRYGMLVYASARRRGCSDHTAEEIVQDVMLSVFEHRDLFDYDSRRGRFRDWLGTVVRNTVVSHRRRPSQRIRVQGGRSDVRWNEPEDGGDEPDALWETAFEQTLLLALLRRDSPRDESPGLLGVRALCCSTNYRVPRSPRTPVSLATPYTGLAGGG